MKIPQLRPAPARNRVLTIAIVLMFGPLIVSLSLLSPQQSTATAPPSSKRMADGKHWTAKNLDVFSAASYCYADSQANCLKYGRLYTWDSAIQACQSLGDGWRLPTSNDWRQMAKHYGGMHDDSEDGGKSAYKSLLIGGPSGFDAILGGGRDLDGSYARLEAHGFYWTASEAGAKTASFYNFAGGAQALFLQDGGEKQRAFSVRCVRD